MVLFVSEFHPDSCVVAEVRASPNHGDRKGVVKPNMLVLHYTGMVNGEAALQYLCSPISEVSAHYVVMEDGYIVQCVPDSVCAWNDVDGSATIETIIRCLSVMTK